MTDITGTPNADLLSGDVADDLITGLAGDDTIDGGGGDDTIDAGEGNDVIAITVLGGTSSFDGGTGIDTLDLSGLGLAGLTNVSIDLGATSTISGETMGAMTGNGSTSFEATLGDFSDDRLNPTALNFALGANIVSASQNGNPRDIDYITFEVPEGAQLTELIVNSFSTFDPGFIGIQEGSTFTEDPNGASPGNILGGLVYGSSDVGENILDDIGSAIGFIGFSGPLGAGTYTVWLNQTGGASSTELNFVFEGSGPVSVDTIFTTAGIENVLGTDGDDVITGDGFANELSGGDGDDTIIGSGGSDTLIGGEGADLLIADMLIM